MINLRKSDFMKWLESEINLIKENYLNMTDEEMSIKLFNGIRSKRSIEKKRLSLGLNKVKTPVQWSDEEINILINNFPYFTTKEVKDMFLPNREERYINEKAKELGLVKTEQAIDRTKIQKGNILSDKLKGREFSDEHKENISKARKQLFSEGKLVSPLLGRVVSEEEKQKSRERVKGRWEGDKNPRHLNPLFGDKNGMWYGGITSLSQALREKITDWKKLSMDFCNYKCLLTNKEFDNIHHIIPFNIIIKEALNELNLDIRENLSLYSKEESNLIINLVREKHDILGVCLCGEIHKLFHDIYSYNNFNMDNFIEFINNYFNGVYDYKLSDNYKSTNSSNTLEYVINKINNLK